MSKNMAYPVGDMETR